MVTQDAKQNFFARIVISLLYRIVLFTAKCLKQLSRADFEKALFSVDKKEGVGLSRPLEIIYRADKSKSLVTGHSIGFPVDSLRLEMPPKVLPDWAKEIKTFLLNQLSDHTRRAYESDLKHFFLFVDRELHLADISRLLTEHIVLYRKYLEEGRLNGKPLEKSTINRKLAVLKSFLNWLRLHRYLTENPAELVKGYPQSQESSLKGLSDEEARQMLVLPNRNSRSGALHGAILHCLLYLGLRKSELIGLKMGDVGQERGVDVLKVRGKGHRVRILPLTQAVKAALEHYFLACSRNVQESEAPLFTPTKNPRMRVLGKPLNPNAITYMVVRYARKAGILKKISPHSCRATCISHALDKKATHRSVQHLAGWSTPLMIQRYDKRREDLKNSAAFLIDYS